MANEIAARITSALSPDFRILRLLGEGAVAQVYLAAETALERLVAVKVLRPELAADVVTRERFAREARSAARIVHPNVVAVHRVGALADGLPYIVMEYVQGRTLEDLLSADGPLPPAGAVPILAQVAAALAAAHEKRIVHRDLRPGNILIEKGTNRAVLSDFGIAAIMETGSEVLTRLTQAGQLLGDPRYTSPEQLLGSPAMEESDVYSFGIVGYELLTGGGPFGELRRRGVASAHLNAQPQPLQQLRPDVPPALARLLEHSLAKKPQHRPTAAELAQRLSQPLTVEEGRASRIPAVHEPPFMPALSSFLNELRRRRVYRATAAYLAGAFVVLEAVDVISPALSMPEWVVTALVVVAVAAFPVVLVLAWLFDINRTGIQRTADPASGNLLPGDRLVRRVLEFAAVALSVAGAALLGWWMLR